MDVFPTVVGFLELELELGLLYGNRRLRLQFEKLLMMGIIMPETC
jgi:hypothetical protein